MVKALGATTGVIGIALVDRTAALVLLVSAVVVGGLVLVARLTASPVAVGHAHTETWFDHPDGELVVRGARRAATRR